MTAPRAERSILNEVRLALGRNPDVRLWRNECGVAVHLSDRPANRQHVCPHCGHEARGARHVRYGLQPGSSDLIGLRSVLVGPEHIGKTIAQFAALELKTRTGKPTEEQLMFIRNVNRFGGVAGIVRSTDDALALLGVER